MVIDKENIFHFILSPKFNQVKRCTQLQTGTSLLIQEWHFGGKIKKNSITSSSQLTGQIYEANFLAENLLYDLSHCSQHTTFYNPN